MDKSKRKRTQKFYAIRHGVQDNVILRSWGETRALVDHFPSAQFKSFLTMQNAQKYLNGEPTDEQIEAAAKAIRQWTIDKRTAYRVALDNFIE
jgi:viroplasmin and RNaseH domain-containing protein